MYNNIIKAITCYVYKCGEGKLNSGRATCFKSGVYVGAGISIGYCNKAVKF
jgi:hypothetical protein